MGQSPKASKAQNLLKQLQLLGKQSTFLHLEDYCFDRGRSRRTGLIEAIYAPQKNFAELLNICLELQKLSEDIFITRADENLYQDLLANGLSSLEFHKKAGVIYSGKTKKQGILRSVRDAKAAVLSAGSSDSQAFYEAIISLEFMGAKVQAFFDIGISSLERLLKNLEEIEKADVIIVVCGMEASLASIVAGLSRLPVIGVPSSSGYGINEGGVNALFSMLGSCAPGLAVVNIDNGFGAACFALKILQKRHC